MDRKQRPVGREKQVGTGKATIHKRGEGVGSSGPQSGKIGSKPGFSGGKTGPGSSGGGQRTPPVALWGKPDHPEEPASRCGPDF